MSEQDEQPRIKVQTDGPYLVSGSVRLTRTAIEETDHGEPVSWEDDEDVEGTRPRYALCRCGRSSNKPFCDGTHKTWDFNGSETADRTPREARIRTFRGKGVTMTDDRSVCDHSGFCGDRETDVWHMIRHTADPEVRERLIGMVRRCPSGRLAVAPPDGKGSDLEPTFDPSVAVVCDGPLWVRGEVEVVSADGQTYEVRNRVTLCRCGESSNKPLCDGTHRENGFRDPG
ncbi:MAG: CDGSH iron-sulfur domain-containing protein [Actinomycetota bacterium]